MIWWHLRQLNSKDWTKRQRSAEKLGEASANKAVTSLIALLSDPESIVRNAAAKALGKIADTEAVLPLIATLQDEDSEVRQNVAMALRQLSDARAVEPLIAALKDANRDVRLAVVLALQAMKDKRATEPLTLLLKDADVEVRLTTLKALPVLEDSRSLVPLLGVLQDQEHSLRVVAAQTLGKMKDSRAISNLIPLLTDTHAEVRSATLAALDTLNWQPSNDTELVTRAIARGEWKEAAGLGVAAVTTLTDLLEKDSDETGDVRRLVINALAEIGDNCSVPALEKLLNDPSKEAQKMAVAILGNIGDASLANELIPKLKDNDPSLKRLAAVALAKKGDVRAIEPLIELLNQQDNQITVARALVMLGPTAVPRLIAKLKSGDEATRAAAAQVLGALKASEAVDLLIKALDIWKPAIAAAAATALGEIGDERAVQPLLALLNALPSSDRSLYRSSYGSSYRGNDFGAYRLQVGANTIKSTLETGFNQGNLIACIQLLETFNSTSDHYHRERLGVTDAAVKALGKFGGTEIMSKINRYRSQRIDRLIESVMAICNSAMVSNLDSQLQRAMRKQLEIELSPGSGIAIQGIGAVASQGRLDTCPHCHLYFPNDGEGIKLKFDASPLDHTRQAIFCPHCDSQLNIHEFLTSSKQ